MMIRVLVSRALELPLSALVPDSGAHRNHDAAQVEVVPVGNVIQFAAFDLLGHGELVGIPTGILGDSSHEHIGADHCGGENHEVVALSESDDNEDESDAGNNCPEYFGVLYLESVAYCKGKKSSSRTTKKCDTKFQGIGKKDTKKDASNSTETKDKPVDPIFTFMLHEK